MIKAYWQEIIHHQHDIMIPVFIVYLTIMYFLGKWFVRRTLKEELGKVHSILSKLLER